MTGSAPLSDWATAEEAVTQARNMAQESVQRGEFDRAVEYLEQALAYTNASPEMLLDTVYHLANTLREIGRYDAAEAVALKFRVAAEQAQDTANLSRALNILGQIASYRGDFAAAEDMLFAARDLAPSRLLRAISLSNIAVLEGMMGNNEGLLSCAKRALELYREEGDHVRAAVTGADIAYSLGQQRQFEDAVALFEVALQQLREVGADAVYHHTLQQMAETLAWAGRLEEAEAAIERADAFHRRGGNLVLHIEADIVRGIILEKRGSLHGAQVAYQQAATEFARIGHLTANVRANQRLSAVEQQIAQIFP